ncbi:MAG: hypothetical protein GC161_07640 [Planctomycetaceae bacterium]|nr:hypothetical protein [Planctomycetaceae bacterium]
MQDRFEPELRAALNRARLIAQRQGLHQIGTAHLALGLLTTDGQGQPPCAAAQSLAGLGADIPSLGQALQEGLVTGPVRFFPPNMGFEEMAGRAMQLAINGAQQMGHAGIGTEHVLAALMQEPEGPLVKGLAPQSIDAKRVIEGLNPLFQARPREAAAATAGQAVPGTVAPNSRMTESGQRVLNAASALAQRYGHGPAGTPHLVLALLDDTDRMLTSLLRRAGVNPTEVRQLLLQQLRVDA